MCGATSESTLSHTTPCSIRATPASVAGRARDPPYLGKPSARGGGAAPGRPNAGCTRSPSSVGRRAVSGDLMTIPPHGGTLVQRLDGEDERPPVRRDRPDAHRHSSFPHTRTAPPLSST